MIPWTAAYQAPPSMGFSTQEYWSGVPSPSPNIRYEVREIGIWSSDANRRLIGKVPDAGKDCREKEKRGQRMR